MMQKQYMKTTQLFLLVIFVFCLSTYGDKISVDTTVAIPEDIKKDSYDSCIFKAKFIDTLGEHFVMLTRKYTTDEEGKEDIFLKAQQWILRESKWVLEWIIKDHIECQNLDISGDFIKDLTTFTDLDKNKIIETTVSYFLICTGAVEPKEIKVIMRQGEKKYTVRGQSLVVIDEKTKYGGTFKTDSILDSKLFFKEYLISLWKKAAGVR